MTSVLKTRLWSDVFGFEMNDLRSVEALSKRLHKPMNPTSLAAFRIVFGILLTIDLFNERGFLSLDDRWGNDQHCRFPLVDSIPVPPLTCMYVLYTTMLVSCTGIVLGLMYRMSCVVYALCYWYIFLLDKLAWNNHSYMFGLLASIMCVVDGHKAWSLDELIRRRRHPHTHYNHVPTWNYALLRFQIFIVYFIAGLKKLTFDWIAGHSVRKLAAHWIFAPFTLVVSEWIVDLVMVHIGGLILDLSLGFLLYFDDTRPLAFVFGGSFHIMNSIIFPIGMFPYAMLVTMVLFCSADWPVTVFRWLVRVRGTTSPDTEPVEPNTVCANDQTEPCPPNYDENQKKVKNNDARHREVRTIALIFYVFCQFFLPYSHFITEGYNNWTDGLYGYSWDMMVHSWSLQHVRVTYADDSGAQGYIDPKIFVRGCSRWSWRPDTVHQYARCVRERLRQRGVQRARINMDVWLQLNGRFQQRALDPRVDLASADWHPLRRTTWLMPLLSDLSDWRTKMDEVEHDSSLRDEDAEIVFVADFPGMTLENYVHADLKNTSITVLDGEIAVEIVSEKKNYTLTRGNRLQVPANEFHLVHSIGESPSCYMYIFINTTYTKLLSDLREYEILFNASTNNGTQPLTDEHLKLHRLAKEYLKYRMEKPSWHGSDKSAISETVRWIKKDLITFYRSYLRWSVSALWNVFTCA